MAIHDTTKYYQFFYNNDWPLYFTYGNLYLKGYTIGICPSGWRLPTREDWEKLFSNYPESELYEALMPGGESDFGVNLSGMGTGTRVEDAIYQGIDRQGYYWSSTKPAGGSSPSTWIVTFDKPGAKVLRGFSDENKKLYAVRCVKDAD